MFALRFHRSLGLAVALGLVATAAACTDTDDDVATGDGAAFVFGLSEADVVDLYDLTPRTQDLDTWVDLHRGSFQCLDYGTLCDDVGPQAAYDIIEEAYMLALGGASADEVDAYVWPAIDAAARDWDAQMDERTLRSSRTSYFYNGSSNKRLKIRAKAVKILLTTRLKASGTCTMQTKTLGVWTKKKADSLDGVLEAVFGPSGLVWTDVENRSNVNSVDFGPHDEHADTLTVTLECEAELGAWDASGTVVVQY